MNKILSPTSSALSWPYDKSLGHRVLFFAFTMPYTKFIIKNLVQSADVQTSLECLQKLGLKIISQGDNEFTIQYLPSKTLQNNVHLQLDCENSGTTARHLIALLAALKRNATITGDKSLKQRDMLRIVAPLNEAGAGISLTHQRYLPVTTSQAPDIQFKNPVHIPIASAQVKSSLLLAAAITNQSITLQGQLNGRDHTERYLKAFGAQLKQSHNLAQIIFSPGKNHTTTTRPIKLPLDPSSMAYLTTAILLSPTSSHRRWDNVLLNPTRMGFFQVLKDCGAPIFWEVTHDLYGQDIQDPSTLIEPVGSLHVSQWETTMTPIQIHSSMVPSLIDELPLLFFIAAWKNYHGHSHFHGVEELTHKESNRIIQTQKLLQSWKIPSNFTTDQVINKNTQQRQINVTITPKEHIDRATLSLSNMKSDDHRIVMLRMLGNLLISGNFSQQDQKCQQWQVSFPDFPTHLRSCIPHQQS